MPGALEGLKVIDASRVLAGPFAAQILADHGANVIKVESPEGDECRGFGPPFVDNSSAYFNAVNRNKRAIVLDMNAESGRQVFWKLLESADVLIENFKASTLRSWGIENPADITARLPKLVHCRITGFGDDGPLGELPGYDAVVQAMSGLISINGEPGRLPVRLGSPIVDMTTGMNTALAALLALQDRNRTGKGQMADVALYDSAVSMAHPYLTNFLASGKTPKPAGNGHPNIVPYNLFETATTPIFVAVANNRQFRLLCQLLGSPALADDLRYASNGKRVENRADLEVELKDLFGKVQGESFGEELLRRGVPAAAILDVGTVAKAPHTAHREMVLESPDYRGPGIPVKLVRTPGMFRMKPPQIGEHKQQVLSESGFTESEISSLEVEGAFGEAKKQ
ncbi:CoA transferase [Caballeronia sp. LP006]|uniref:CaiB/BaiF CoA transferase family protein n=1 Tax=Caballeronia sp. LP006 TaxID=3038552 RepID=UPI0028634C4A|nr:CoA transferase [Caballeronia sp. LP006]MDR5826281.1 CoA transferase [Caballeronia sp. LP006]